MKLSTTLAALAPLFLLGVTIPSYAQQADTTYEQHYYSEAELDSLLAPIALYPDTLLTHVLIASTYPLQVIEADRWRQANSALSSSQVESAIEGFDWEPSIKALAPFTDVLHSMSQDLNWLETLGDNVIIDEARVLDRVQQLRQEAYQNGHLTGNRYQQIYHNDQTIIVESASPDIVYVPYYNPVIVFGALWHHAISPVIWHHSHRHHLYSGVYWSSSIKLSAAFYFGDIRWRDRYVVVSHRPTRFYDYGHRTKRIYSKEYQRWHHNTQFRRANYSRKVVRSVPQRQTQWRQVKVDKHRELTRAVNQQGRVTKNNVVVDRRQQQSAPSSRPNRDYKKPDKQHKTNQSQPPASAQNQQRQRQPSVRQQDKTKREVVKQRQSAQSRQPKHSHRGQD